MTEITEVPSPFCGMGTDDLTVSVDGTALQVTENGCAVNTPAFEQPLGDSKPRVAGKEVPLQEAAKVAAELLAKAQQPLVAGCATDVNGMRALLSLADHSGAILDNMHFNAARRNILAMQDSGWMNTTLAEVKNRCDLLLVVGTDLESFAPRFFERYLWNQDSMFVEDTGKREIIYLGKAPSGSASTAPDGRKADVHVCDDQDLPEVLSVLRALVKGHPVQAESAGGIAAADLQAIADRLQQAAYGVVTWAAGAFDFYHAELAVQTLCEMVKDINDRGTRCSGLPLGGREGDQTASQVSGWTTGYPPRISFSRGFPDYDPYLYDAVSLLAGGEADILLWVSSFDAAKIPPDTDVPSIVIGRSGMTFAQEPEVFIPVGTPGIDHSGHAYRMDNVVAIRLKKLRDSGLPSTSEVVTAIQQAL